MDKYGMRERDREEGTLLEERKKEGRGGGGGGREGGISTRHLPTTYIHIDGSSAPRNFRSLE